MDLSKVPLDSMGTLHLQMDATQLHLNGSGHMPVALLSWVYFLAHSGLLYGGYNQGLNCTPTLGRVCGGGSWELEGVAAATAAT